VVLLARFERIFTLKTGFVTLDRLLVRLHKKKSELPMTMMLDHPAIPLHTNGSENDVRSQVTRRKVSGGTRSDAGRDPATGSSAWQKPALNCEFRSGIILERVWLSQVPGCQAIAPLSEIILARDSRP
jgi:hypothetical protein